MVTSTESAKNLREDLARNVAIIKRVKPDLVRSEYSNLITNGGFDADSDWTKGTGWTIGSGVASKGTADNSSIYQPSNLVAGRHYKTSVEIAVSSGSAGVRYSIDGVTSAFANGGSLATQFTAKATTIVYINGGSFSGGSIDNVSLWEADPSDGAPWLRLTQGHVFDDRSSIWRDDAPLYEGEYEVINHFGQTFIKPITAPGVNTRFQLFTAPEKRP